MLINGSTFPLVRLGNTTARKKWDDILPFSNKNFIYVLQEQNKTMLRFIIKLSYYY